MKSITTERINELKGNLSQDEFAKRINSSQPVISKILNGDQPSINILTALSNCYNVSVDWLLGLSDRKFKNGYSIYNETQPTTYADICSLIVTLLKNNSISKVSIDTINEYSHLRNGQFVLYVNDLYIQDLVISAETLLKSSPESIETWLENISNNYDFVLLPWTNFEATYHTAHRLNKTSLEILKERIHQISVSSDSNTSEI